MKYLIVLLMGLFMFSYTGISQQKIKSDLKKEGVKGKVKTITVFSNYRLGRKVSDPDYYGNVLVKSFDKTGNLTEKKEFSKYDDADKKTIFGLKKVYKYDDKGNKIEMNDYFEDGNFNKTKYKYDTTGKLIESDAYRNNDGSLLFKTTYKYDDKGNLTQDDGTNAYQSLLYLLTNGGDEIGWRGDDAIDNSIIRFLYGENITSKIIDGGGAYGSICKYKYNNKGNIIEIAACYGMDWTLNYIKDSILTFKYNNNGDTIECTRPGNFKKIIMNYDEKKNKIITTSMLREGRNMLLKFKNGLLNSYENMDLLQVVTYKYTYDNFGNWIKREAFCNGEINKEDSEKREIEYYN